MTGPEVRWSWPGTAAGHTLIVSPEDGDGETWYYEVSRTLRGDRWTWDGRAETEADAEAEAAELLARLTRDQDEWARKQGR